MEDAIGYLTAFSPNVCPNYETIRALKIEIITKSMSIKHPQAPILGYAAQFMQPEEVAHTKPNPWVDPIDPGDHANLPANAFMTENESRNLLNQYEARKIDNTNLKKLYAFPKMPSTKQFLRYFARAGPSANTHLEI